MSIYPLTILCKDLSMIKPAEKHIVFDHAKYQGRNLVISDIHGCSKTFKALLEKVELIKSDNLFLLGDYIDVQNSRRKQYLITQINNN